MYLGIANDLLFFWSYEVEGHVSFEIGLIKDRENSVNPIGFWLNVHELPSFSIYWTMESIAIIIVEISELDFNMIFSYL